MKAVVVYRKFRPEFRPVKMRTICQVLRELMQRTVCPVETALIDEAYDMAKRMQRKLLNYNRIEVYSSVNFGTDDLISMTPDDLRDIIKALQEAQKAVPSGEIKVNWDKLIDYFRKHLAE